MIRAVVLLLEKEGKILFVKRSLGRKSLPGKWSLCSGKVEVGEEIFDTAKREAMEELGIELFDLEIFGEQEIKKEGEHKVLYFVKAKYNGELKVLDEKEFSEIREYMPGDDIRAIDWKVTARFNHPFVKQFIEERELNLVYVW